jgi:hypothetical protein
MNARDILFKTCRFNLSKIGKHFVNPCCFGEDLAAWLRIKLADNRVEVSLPGQEDWGWYLQAKYGGDAYFLGMSGNAEENSTNVDDGEWRIIVKKNLSIWQRLRGMCKIATDDAMVILVEQLLRSESDFKNVHRDDGR